MSSFSSVQGFSSMVSSKMRTPPASSISRTMGLTSCQRVLESKSSWAGKRVIWSWLREPSSRSDRPVAVVAPKELKRATCKTLDRREQNSRPSRGGDVSTSDAPSGQLRRHVLPGSRRRWGVPFVARGQACPLLSCHERTPSWNQGSRRSNCSTVSANRPNIRWHSTLAGPRTRTWRPPKSSLRRLLTRSTVERSR